MSCSCKLCRFNKMLSALMIELYKEHGKDEFTKTEFRKILSWLRGIPTDSHMTERYWKAAERNDCIDLLSRDSATLSESALYLHGKIPIKDHKHLPHRCPVCNRNFSSDSIVIKHLVNVHNFSDYRARYLMNMIERDL